MPWSVGLRGAWAGGWKNGWMGEYVDLRVEAAVEGVGQGVGRDIPGQTAPLEALGILTLHPRGGGRRGQLLALDCKFSVGRQKAQEQR
jgi:hypothetical protein